MTENKVRIKTISGEPQRSVFTAFEILALQHAVACGFGRGAFFEFGKDCEGFSVIELTENSVTLRREKSGKVLVAKYELKESKGESVHGTAEETESKTNENKELKEMELMKGTAVAAEKTNEMKAGKSREQILSELLAQFSGGGLDEAAVREIVADEINELRPQVTRVEIAGVPPVEIKGKTHDRLKVVLFLMKNGLSPYLVGDAGCGKTFLAKQCAEVLGLDFYANSALQDKSELTGYCDINGNYVETDFYKAFKNGGVFLLDEIDATSAEVLVPFNIALANGVFSFPGIGAVNAHENFMIIAAANTAGQGKTAKYNGRFKLDASTLDRFAFIELDYCREIELQMAGGDEGMVEFVRCLREKIDATELPYTATPRALERIHKLLSGGFDVKTALEIGLCGGWEKSDVRMLSKMLSEKIGGNMYAVEFAKLYK